MSVHCGQETDSVRGQIRDSKWNWNSVIDYSDEEIAGNSNKDSTKKILINEVTDYIRDKRQIQSDISKVNDGDITTDEPLLVEDPKGWGLAHVLGTLCGLCLIHTKLPTDDLYIRIKRMNAFRSCISSLPSYLHHWHYLQTDQNAHGNLRERRPCVFKIQIVKRVKRVYDE